MFLNLQLMNAGYTHESGMKRPDFGRIIFHTNDVDELYHFMRNDKAISSCVVFENEPSNAQWGERFFHLREPNGYQLSFAQPIVERGNQRD